jgi:hypothetical protein
VLQPSRRPQHKMSLRTPAGQRVCAEKRTMLTAVSKVTDRGVRCARAEGRQARTRCARGGGNR